LRIRDHRTSRRHKPAEDTSCPPRWPLGRPPIPGTKTETTKSAARTRAPKGTLRKDRTFSRGSNRKSTEMVSITRGRLPTGARRRRFVTTAGTLRRRTELRRGRHGSCALCHAFSSHLGQIANL